MPIRHHQLLAFVCYLIASLAFAGVPGCSDSSAMASPDVAEAKDTTTDEPSGEPAAASLTSDEVAEPGPYRVGVITLQLEDTSRPTPPNGDIPGAESRTLVTEVWYPAASGGPVTSPERDAAPAFDEAFPIIVYSHGLLSGRAENTALTAQLASRGFVVAAPDYPLTSMAAPGGANVADVVNQPGDVSFIIDQLIERGAADGSPFGRVDDSRIALMGVSLGGLTSLITAFHPDYRDARTQAVLAAAAPGCFLQESVFATAATPLMLVHGDLDEIVPYAENASPTYGAAQAPKRLVTLVGGTHTAFGALAADILANMDNPEAVGCAALDANPSIEGDALSTLAAEVSGLSPEEIAACPTPCSTEGDRPVSMNARRQLDLFELVTVAFFEEQLRDDTRHGQFLDETLASEQDDVTVQVEP